MVNVAVVIGIDRYATDLTSLEGAVADAQCVACWLVQSGAVAAVDLQLGLLPTPFSPPDPAVLGACTRIGTTLLAVDQVLARLLQPAFEIGRFYFFFSGHGASSNNPAYAEEAICLEGYDDATTIKALELSSLMSVLNAIPAEERFVWIDGCRNAVFADDIQFGTLSRRPRAAKGQRRNYVLRATGPGRKAAEVGQRGLFARHLCDGLGGMGSAKRWDPAAADGDGGYTVRWRALAQYVAAQVAEQRAAQRNEQLIFEEGEHPAEADPQLAAFTAGHFAKSRITVTLRDPSAPPDGTRVCLRRNDSIDPEVWYHLPAIGSVEVDVAPSAWVLSAQAAGWRSRPRSKPVLVYADRVVETIDMVQEAPPPVPAGVVGLVLGGPGPFTQVDTPSPTVHLPEPPTDGRLTLTVGGLPPSVVHPSVRLAVRRENGDVVADPVLTDALVLPPGLYRFRLDIAGGAWSETSVLVSPGDDEPLLLPIPQTATTALLRTLAVAEKPAPYEGFAQPSEQMGPLVGTTVATVAAIAVVQAVNGAEAGLRRLQLAQRWATGSGIGVEVVIADEREAPDPGESLPPLARLWRMGKHAVSPVPSWLAPANPEAPIVSASLEVEPGGWWLQLRDQDRRRRAGFKLAVQVLPGHVTLVVRHRLTSGMVGLHQYAIRREPSERLDIQFALVEAEAFQRSRSSGRDPTADPVVRDLVDGKWFEPFSAMVAAAALLERGEAGTTLSDQVLQRLIAHGIPGPDVTVLRAAQAARLGSDDQARALVQEALALRQAPVVDALLERLDVEAKRLGLRGQDAAWIAEKLRQTVGHPLWTLRREDDKRRSGVPEEG